MGNSPGHNFIVKSAVPSFAFLVFSWISAAICIYIGNIPVIQEHAQYKYGMRLIIVTLFFLEIMLSALSISAVSTLGMSRKVFFIVFLCIHFIALMSLILMDSGANIPLLEVSVFLMSAVLLFISSMVNIIKSSKA
ncbi:hypothetical protein [Alloscardovia omnicolens]|uniref:hypothetical protein n=1 Tax=Alloscardovia omnicolens TaxID=419015 RepID=UPI003A64C92B